MSSLTHKLARPALLDFWNPKTWERPAAKVIEKLIPAAVRRRLLDVPASRMYDDTARYLEEALEAEQCPPLAMLMDDLRVGLLREFGALRAFHACKPTSIDTYFRDGLRPLNRAWLEKEAFDSFEGTVSREEIAAAAAAADLDLREGKVYFETDGEGLVATSGHYLIYGPESMSCLWNDAGRFHGSQERQRNRGVPTLFECAVPLRLIDEEFQEQWVRTVTTIHFKRRSKFPEEDQGAEDWGFSISEPLPPECIIGHTHPAVISDPLRHGIDYHSPAASCDWCAPSA